MKLSILKGELQRGLSRIQSIVDKRNSMPILANVLFRATEDGILELTATDLEVGIRSSHPADVSSAGSLTVAAKKLFELVRELPEEKVELFSEDEASLSIRSARARFSLPATSAEEYPTLPEIKPERMVLVQPAVLGEMIERTMYAASVDETRYNLNGVYLEVLPETGQVRMVATDGHRLARVDRVLSTDATELKSNIIIPRKGLSELKKLIDEDDSEELELAFEGNNGLARKGGVTLVMRLIEGEFPNYKQVIPKEAKWQLVLPADILIQALRRVLVFSSERSRAIKVEISDGKLRISCQSADVGEGHEELDVDYAGDPLNIGFNGRYLMDCLMALRSKEVRLWFQDDLSPVRVLPTDDEGSLAVVMPMRI